MDSSVIGDFHLLHDWGLLFKFMWAAVKTMYDINECLIRKINFVS